MLLSRFAIKNVIILAQCVIFGRFLQTKKKNEVQHCKISDLRLARLVPYFFRVGIALL